MNDPFPPEISLTDNLRKLEAAQRKYGMDSDADLIKKAIMELEKLPYDSTADTNAHILRVRELLFIIINNIERRLYAHDKSKLAEPEKSVFDKVTPKLKALTYGSPEYAESLAEMGAALDHHYAKNSHHPQHYVNGINGMSLLDLIELLADWKAAGERHADGSMEKSLKINKDRFYIGGQLEEILWNTVKELNW